MILSTLSVLGRDTDVIVTSSTLDTVILTVGLESVTSDTQGFSGVGTFCPSGRLPLLDSMMAGVSWVISSSHTDDVVVWPTEDVALSEKQLHKDWTSVAQKVIYFNQDTLFNRTQNISFRTESWHNVSFSCVGWYVQDKDQIQDGVFNRTQNIN